MSKENPHLPQGMYHTYQNGNYVVYIKDDGTKIRTTADYEFRPRFAESIDLKITDRCDGGCPFCYEECTPAGKHADIMDAVTYGALRYLHPYTELAINGNDLSHPDLIQFLETLKDHRVFTNITVNIRHFLMHRDILQALTEKKLIHGLGISIGGDEQVEALTTEIMKPFPDAVIHVIYGITKVDTLRRLAGHGLKLLVLGYKDIGRGHTYFENNVDGMNENATELHDRLSTIIEEKWFDFIGFDNLALEQLDLRNILGEKAWDDCYMGDDGEFTFYLDLVKGEYARNSMAPPEKRYPVGDKDLIAMFADIKKGAR